MIYGGKMTTYSYKTDSERESIISEQESAGMVLIEEQNLVSGNFLIFKPDETTLSDALVSKLAALAAKRYEVETGGITVDGVAVATDRDSQALLTGAWCRCRQAAGTTVNWKGTNGWTQLDADAIESLAAAVSDHVEACFTAEKTHSEAISALATVAAVDAYDFSTGWPDNNK